ncbi:MAG: DMT family transporter, partial [Rikenellaceae bacterium]
IFTASKNRKIEMSRLDGVLWGALAGASFGLIPLFTLPLIADGLSTDSILFYRFAIAALMLSVVLIIKGEDFRVSLKQLLWLFVLGSLYMSSAFFLLWGYEFMAAGIATAVHFLYPVCVVVLMILFFGERASLVNICAVMLAVVGVVVLSAGDSASVDVDVKGIVIVVISSLAYAFYIIGVKKTGLEEMGGFKLSFYVLLVTALLFGVKALLFGDGIMPINSGESVINVVLLAFIPTVVSNFALVRAIKTVGSTTTSILGALEPMTAVTIGVLIFHDLLKMAHVIGIFLIIAAVVTIVIRKSKVN